MKELKKIAKEWNALKTDKQRWEYLLSHKDKIGLMLDNDGTYPVFHSSITPTGEVALSDDLPDMEDFDDWIGNSPGLDILLPLLGIEAEGV